VGLFKYLDASKLVFFENCLVLLTPPAHLNDPWDFLPKGRVPSEDEILQAWREIETEIARSSVIDLPVQFKQREQRRRLERMRVDFASKEFLSEQGKNYREEISKIVGVVSLTELPLSPVMWAHYAQSHTGFVAEFAADDKTEMNGFRIRMCAVGPIVAGKVKYELDFKQIEKDASNVHQLCWSKHRDWEHEQEWRIIWSLQEPPTRKVPHAKCGEQQMRYCLPFEPSGLRRVIFGMGMKAEVKQRLCDMLSREKFKHVLKQTTAIDPKTGELVLNNMDSP